MGMLYSSCSKCGRSCGIQAQFICNIKCENCRKIMSEKCNKEQMFKIWHFKCEKCNFQINFEGMTCNEVICISDNQPMKETSPIALERECKWQ